MVGRGPGDACSGNASTLKDGRKRRLHNQLLLCCWTTIETRCYQGQCSPDLSWRQASFSSGRRHRTWNKQSDVELPPVVQMPLLP